MTAYRTSPPPVDEPDPKLARWERYDDTWLFVLGLPVLIVGSIAANVVAVPWLVASRVRRAFRRSRS